MKATYWQRGEALDYKNETSTTIAENTVIRIKTRIGITGMAIEPGMTGSLHVCGTFEMAKTENEEVEFGDLLFCTGNEITKTSEGNVPAGYAAQSSKASDKTVLVKLLG